MAAAGELRLKGSRGRREPDLILFILWLGDPVSPSITLEYVEPPAEIVRVLCHETGEKPEESEKEDANHYGN